MRDRAAHCAAGRCGVGRPASGDRHPHDGRVEAGGHNADHVGIELKYGG
ncbi:hypothetical protein C7S13_3312 [Burkholderia cepacia]|nr:hypothetical protein [Burkholderia cepacia]